MLRKGNSWGTWVAQSVKRPTSALVMISRFLGSSPALGSMLTAQRLKPASDSVVSLSLSALPHQHSVSLCLSKMNKNIKKIFLKRNDSSRTLLMVL